MNRLALALGLSVALAACQKEAPPAPKAAPPAAPTAAAAPPHRSFGDGYRGAKWGASPAEVEQLFHAPVTRGAAPGEPDLVREEFVVPAPNGQPTDKRIDAFFWNGKLMRAIFTPHFKDDYADGFGETFRALTSKYGAGQPIGGMKDQVTGVPVDLVAWNDGVTLIQLRVDRRPPPPGAKEEVRLYSTTAVVYTSIALAQEREKQAAPPPAAH